MQKKKGFSALDDLDGDDDDDEFSDDDEDMQTALDPLDPFVIFTDTMAGGCRTVSTYPSLYEHGPSFT